MKLKSGSILAALLLGTSLALAGCASFPATPNAPEEVTPEPEETQEMESEAVWLDNGRAIGIVTWGSSSCVPFADEVTAAGQDISVTLTATLEGEEVRPCTADFAPRVSVVGTPEGVNAHEDATINVMLGEEQLSLELGGNDTLTGVPGESTDYAPSAAWMAENVGIILLTWGSSTCVPVVQSIDEGDGGIVATFQPATGPCTMDMVPRATILGLSEAAGSESTLTLVGDNLDGTVQVIG